MRKGCAPLLFFSFLMLIVAAIAAWSLHLDRAGILAQGAVTDKRESIRIHDGDWTRDLEVVAAYRAEGEHVQRPAGCEVDEQTYDALHRGDSVAVRYLTNPALLDQPFLPAARLSACTTYAAINRKGPLLRKAAWAIGVFAVLIFLWRVLHVRLGGWLLLPWAGFLFVLIFIPHTEPAPRNPHPAMAAVTNVTTITSIFQSDTNRGIELLRPYQIVELSFVPDGAREAVIAVDEVDQGSVPELVKGRAIAIAYDTAHPRTARIQGGTRSFPAQAVLTAVVYAGICVALLVVCCLIYRGFQMIARNPRVQAVQQAAEERRRLRRGGGL